MIKKLLFFATILLIVSCNTTKPMVQTSRTSKPIHPVVRTVRKPIEKNETKPIEKKVAEHPTTEVKSIETNRAQVETNSPKTEVLEATTKVKVTPQIVLAYIELYKDIAKNNMTQFGIPCSIILAQGILESGAGTGPLCMQANNHFGIKCHKEWTGLSIKHDDDAAQECFRKYEKSSESYKDHALFLTSRPWYAGLFKLNKDDYKAWAKGLRASGYATDPKYPDKLIAIIERYHLNKYDTEVLGMNYTSVTIADLAASKTNDYQVIKGDTLYSISKKFNLSIEELKRKNNISDNPLAIGQNLIVE